MYLIYIVRVHICVTPHYIVNTPSKSPPKVFLAPQHTPHILAFTCARTHTHPPPPPHTHTHTRSHTHTIPTITLGEMKIGLELRPPSDLISEQVINSPLLPTSSSQAHPSWTPVDRSVRPERFTGLSRAALGSAWLRWDQAVFQLSDEEAAAAFPEAWPQYGLHDDPGDPAPSFIYCRGDAGWRLAGGVS